MPDAYAFRTPSRDTSGQSPEGFPALPSSQAAGKPRTHHALGRPDFDCIALLLQGGGALGSYQGGVYQALSEADIHPDWIAGISIGAINSALIAGNPREHRVDRLREFWEMVTASPLTLGSLPPALIRGDFAHSIVNQIAAFGALVGGAPQFFTPRVPPPYLQPPGSIEATSFYETAPLRATLERLVDFDRINAGEMRLSVGAVNIRSGNFAYFDNTRDAITPLHIMASGALPPGFPAVEIEGEQYWDGGLVSNTPLQWVLDRFPRRDTLAFQIDLWNAQGAVPGDLTASSVRQKEIQFSSRTRAATNEVRETQTIRRAAFKFLQQVPDTLRDTPEYRLLAAQADEAVYNIVHLIYRARAYEGTSKDYEFSRRTMLEHWQSGYNDAVRTLRHPEVLHRPDNPEGLKTFDLSQDEG
jgi:NTE family protein